MLAVARTTTTLGRNAIITRAVVQQQTKRGMAGGHGPKPEWTGLDKTVRSYFPEDYQLAGAIMGMYGSLIGLAVLRSKFKSKPPAAPVVPTTTVTASSGIPPVDSPEFETYLASPAFIQLLESEDQLAALMKE